MIRLGWWIIIAARLCINNALFSSYFLFLSIANAAVLSGNVVDYATGRPLARTRVSLEVVGRQAGEVPQPVLTNSAGQFTFSVGSGAFLLKAQRPGYLKASYGQKKWDLPGTPVVLDEKGEFSALIRMQRPGAILGEIWDENKVPLAGTPVFAWKAGKQIKLTAGGMSDDRGMFRIAGLEPGRYYVRTAARELEDHVGLLPTYFGQTARLGDARVVEVRADQETGGVGIEPLRGQLGSIRVTVAAGSPVKVTLFTETGKREQGLDGGGVANFDQLAPGDYEILAETVSGIERSGMGRVTVARDVAEISISLQAAPQLVVNCQDSRGIRGEVAGLAVFARRRDAGEAGQGTRMKCGVPLTVVPGVWEMAAAAPPDMYVASISGAAPSGDAYEISFAPGEKKEVDLRLAGRPGVILGSVITEDKQPAIGAPVFVAAMDSDLRSRLGGVRSVRSNQEGKFSISGLPPGRYEVISSFEVQDPGQADWRPGSGKAVSVDEGAEVKLELEVQSWEEVQRAPRIQ